MNMTVNTYFKRHIKSIILWAIPTVIVSFFAPLKSFQLKWLIDSSSKDEAIGYLLLIFFVTITSYIFESLSRKTFTTIACKAVKSVRDSVVESILHRSVAEYDQEDDSSYISLLTTDIRTLYDDYYMGIFNIVFWGGMMICALCLYLYISPIMLVVIILASIPPLLFPRFVNASLKKSRDNFSAEMSSYTQLIKEYLGGFAVIRSFVRENEYCQRHKEATKNNAAKERSFQQNMNFIITTTSLLSNLIFAFLLLVGIFLVFDGQITLGEMTTAASMGNFVISPCHTITQNYAKIKSSKGIRERLELAMNREHTELNAENAAPLDGIYQLDCTEVSFSYPGSNMPTLCNVSFHLSQHEKVALIGESGCGKSTFIKLLFRNYLNYSGHIYVNGKEISEIDQHNLYQRVGYISQDTFLFNDTIRNNICLFETYDEIQVKKAAKTAGIWDFIASLPNGLDTVISENGKNLSGGQRQRIAIARLVIRNYDLILADEITASLDIDTTEEIMQNLLDLPCSLVVITHDTSDPFMDKFDRVYSVSNGSFSELHDQ